MSNDQIKGEVVPFVKPAVAQKPANDDAPPPARTIIFSFVDHERSQDVVRNGYLIFMNPFIGVGQIDGSVSYLVNPAEVLSISLVAVEELAAA